MHSCSLLTKSKGRCLKEIDWDEKRRCDMVGRAEGENTEGDHWNWEGRV